MGNDDYSKEMLEAWKNEGVGIAEVKINHQEIPGLYIINNDINGERYFTYWRQNSPARTLLSDFPEVLDSLKQYPMIFLSGITLSLYSKDDLSTLFSFLSTYRQAGGVVVFDNNYRERNWVDVATAVEVFSQMMQLTDIALISFDDELSLYGPHEVEDCIDLWSTAGVAEVVVKNGHHGCHLSMNNARSFYPLKNVLKPVDTTAAGDSFNGAYLAAKLQNKTVAECIAAGQACASTVIMHKGAIIDKNIDLLMGAV